MRQIHAYRSLRHAAGLIVAAIACAAVTGMSRAEQTTEAEVDAVAKSIVEKADEIRFPPTGFEVNVAIKSYNSGDLTDSRIYRVLAKGNDNAIVSITEPASERGQIMLMKGHDLWVYLPSVSQPVRLSFSQRLTGQVANGDIARANFAGNYAPRLLRKEIIENESYFVLELTAIDRWVTYHRVLYWVQESNFRPRRAEFYSLSDRLLKTARYENYRQLGGRVRPTRLVLQDALRPDDESILDYSNMQLRDLPERIFNKDYLKRL